MNIYNLDRFGLGRPLIYREEETQPRQAGHKALVKGRLSDPGYIGPAAGIHIHMAQYHSSRLTERALNN